jgi:hypothetical protein
MWLSIKIYVKLVLNKSLSKFEVNFDKVEKITTQSIFRSQDKARLIYRKIIQHNLLIKYLN